MRKEKNDLSGWKITRLGIGRLVLIHTLGHILYEGAVFFLFYMISHLLMVGIYIRVAFNINLKDGTKSPYRPL